MWNIRDIGKSTEEKEERKEDTLKAFMQIKGGREETTEYLRQERKRETKKMEANENTEIFQNRK